MSPQSVPLLPAQHPNWAAWCADPTAGHVHAIGALLRVRGVIDPALLREAFDSVHRAQPGLRVTFHDGPGLDPFQIVHPPTGVWMELVDVSSEPTPHTFARRRAADLANEPFDLRTGPVLKALLVHITETEHLLALSVARVAVDGGSLKLVITAVERAYRALAAGNLPEAEDHTGKFLEVCSSRATADPDGLMVTSYANWIAGVSRPVLPTDFPRPVVPGHRGAEVRLELDPAEAATLNVTARRLHTSLSPLLFAAFGVVIGRFGNQDQFLVGAFTTGRTQPEEEPLVGKFANMLAMPVDLTQPDVVSAASRTWWDGYDYHDTPLHEAGRRVEGDPPPGRLPLTDVEFVLNLGEPELAETGEPKMTREREPTTFALRDLILFTGSTPDGGFELRLEYRTDLYREDTAWDLLRSYWDVLVELNTARAKPITGMLGAHVQDGSEV